MILMFLIFFFQVEQLTNLCRCCLLDVSKCNGPLMEMKSETFDHAGEKINYFDGYLDVNNVSVDDVKLIPFSEFKICHFCSEQLDISFAFRKMCHDAMVALYEKYSTQSVAVDMIEREESGENRYDQTDDFSASSDHSRMINNEKERPFKITVPNERQTGIHDLPVERPTGRNISKCLRKMSSNVAGSSNSKKELSRKFDCKRCLKSYKNKKCLLEHNRNVHEDRKFSCEICLTIFTNSRALYYHIQRDHQNITCPSCGMKFTRTTSLHIHVQSMHQKIRHKCGECQHSFSQRSNLNRHIKSQHSNVQLPKYSCDICSKVCIGRESIRKHMTNVHKEKRYECKICKIKFSNLPRLWEHSFNHRGFMPYNCSVCNVKTVYKGVYKKHLTNQHNMKYNEAVHGYKKETYREVLTFVQ
jgi:hypothetical protein